MNVFVQAIFYHFFHLSLLVSSGAKQCEGLYFRDPFWHHLGDFGRHFGTSWAPRGSQNRPFWHQVAPKTQKMSPRMRHQKMHENLIEI